MMKMQLARYLEQKDRWPQIGNHILAQYDDDSIFVYQAYSSSIAKFAMHQGYFGGSFKFSRMSWIKPNFLWMMYRSDWGTKKGQEFTLAIRIKRSFFDSVLSGAVPSYFDTELYPKKEEWKKALRKSSVRLQWDPDHTPDGSKTKRRALQLGLRDEVLKEYAKNAIIEIIDLSEFVAEQRKIVLLGDYTNLLTPKENIYIPHNRAIQKKLQLSR